MSSSNKTEAHSQEGHPAVLVVVCSALFFGVVNGSAVAVVLPEIGADLSIPTGSLSWILSGFLLTYGVAIPFYGRLASRFGARRLFLIGVFIFAVGSALSALASDFTTLLAARTVQAIGGAAVPGLGMTLAIRAFPEHRRGTVLGIISATMGVGVAVGPLGAGLVSEIANWRYLFAISALSILTVPLGVMYLDRNESLSEEPLDLAGGVRLGLGIAATLFSVTQGSQVGWTQPSTLIGALVAGAAFLSFWSHQGRARSPFIPAALMSNRGYLLLTVLGFAITFANLAAQLGYPFLFSMLHDMTTLDIGIVLIPAAITTAIVGVVAGRIVDSFGAAAPIRVGVILMLASALAISSQVGASRWTIALLAVPLAAGFALVNTPLATSVSLLVRPKDLASALSLNTMMFFVGGSFGATMFTSIVINTRLGANAVNPIHHGSGAGFSNAFAALSIPLVASLALSFALPRRRTTEVAPAADPSGTWSHDCQLPWSPEVELQRVLTDPGGVSSD